MRDRNGNITVLNFPGAEGTVASGINDLGHVVGQYWGTLFGQALQRFHGFIWKEGEYITIDAAFPNAMFTSLSGVNNAGQIIGTYLHQRPGSSDPNDYDSELAFVYDNGSFTSLDFSGCHRTVHMLWSNDAANGHQQCRADTWINLRWRRELTVFSI